MGCPSVGPLACNDRFMSNREEMARIFGTAFASVFTNPSGLSQSSHQLYDGTFSDIELTMSNFIKALNDINPSSAVGPDAIHPALLKKCSNTLSYPLYLIFSKSLLSGAIPDSWQTSHVVPIFKNRSISLTSTSCKTLEKIITSKFYQYLESNLILSVNQFGFW